MEDFDKRVRSDEDECQEIAESMMKEIRVIRCDDIRRDRGKTPLKKIARQVGLARLGIGKG